MIKKIYKIISSLIISFLLVKFILALMGVDVTDYLTPLKSFPQLMPENPNSFFQNFQLTTSSGMSIEVQLPTLYAIIALSFLSIIIDSITIIKKNPVEKIDTKIISSNLPPKKVQVNQKDTDEIIDERLNNSEKVK